MLFLWNYVKIIENVLVGFDVENNVLLITLMLELVYVVRFFVLRFCILILIRFTNGNFVHMFRNRIISILVLLKNYG